MNHVICDACMGRGEQDQQQKTVMCPTCSGSGRIKIVPHHHREHRLLSIKQFAFSLAQSAYDGAMQHSR